MNEAWSNAPSLRYEFMVLKNLNLINFSLFSFFESNDASDIFFLKKKQMSKACLNFSV